MPGKQTALPISGDDASLRAVVAWKRDSENAGADRLRDIAVEASEKIN